jgi:hypothetical protein
MTCESRYRRLYFGCCRYSNRYRVCKPARLLIICSYDCECSINLFTNPNPFEVTNNTRWKSLFSKMCKDIPAEWCLQIQPRYDRTCVFVSVTTPYYWNKAWRVQDCSTASQRWEWASWDVPRTLGIVSLCVMHINAASKHYYYYYYLWGGTESLGICSSP